MHIIPANDLQTKGIKAIEEALRQQSDWRDLAARVALFIFGIVLWHKGSAIAAGSLLILVWILCGGLLHLKETIKEPLAMAILSFCGVLLLGILWSDYPNSGRFRWGKYLGLMIFIPYLSLLNKDRLAWAVGGLVIGYLGMLLMGLYYQFFWGAEAGIPPLKMAHLHYSMGIGIGVLLAIYWASISENRRMVMVMFVVASFLLFIQFNLSGRGPLLATCTTIILLLFLLHRHQLKKLLGILAVATVMMGAFAYHSTTFQSRFTLVETELVQSEQGENQTSVGQRRALYEIGINAISQRPWFGHGTGMAQKSFGEVAESYQEGRFKDVVDMRHLHFHNDLIEMGVHLGLLGISVYLFLLWGWFHSLRVHGLTVLGTTLVCFIFMAGLTDVILIYGQIPSLLLVITAIAIVWQREYGTLTSSLDRAALRA
jgi:O-antigen ligase